MITTDIYQSLGLEETPAASLEPFISSEMMDIFGHSPFATPQPSAPQDDTQESQQAPYHISYDDAYITCAYTSEVDFRPQFSAEASHPPSEPQQLHVRRNPQRAARERRR